MTFSDTCPRCDAPTTERNDGEPRMDCPPYVVYACGSDTLGPHYDGDACRYAQGLRHRARIWEGEAKRLARILGEHGLSREAGLTVEVR